MRLPNLHYLALRLARRPTCIKAATTRLLPSARLLNIGGPDARIRLGAYTIVAGELMVFAHGGRLDIGEWCFVGPGTHIWSAAAISIGNRVLISHGVNIFDSLTHPLNAAARHAQFREIYLRGHPRNLDLSESPVRIADDAWIGAGATILRGVTVGRASVVAAGAVATQDVPDYSIVAGNPARVVRVLSDDERGVGQGLDDN